MSNAAQDVANSSERQKVVAKAVVFAAFECFSPVDTSFAHSTHAVAAELHGLSEQWQLVQRIKYAVCADNSRISSSHAIGRMAVCVCSAVTAIHTIYS